MTNSFYFIIFLFLKSHCSVLNNQIPLQIFKSDSINKLSKRIKKEEKALEKRKILEKREDDFRKSLLCEELLDRHKPQENYFTEEESEPKYMINDLEKTILMNIFPDLLLKQEIDFIALFVKHFDYIKNIFSIKSYQFSKIRYVDPRDFTTVVEECNDSIHTIDQFLKNEKTGLSIFIPQRSEYVKAKKLSEEKNILLQEAFKNKRKELHSFEIIIEQLTIIKKEKTTSTKLIEKCINQMKEISRLYNMMSDRVIAISVNCEIADRCEEIKYYLDSIARTCKNTILKKYYRSILKNLKPKAANYNSNNNNNKDLLLTSSSKNFQIIEPENNMKIDHMKMDDMNNFFQAFDEQNYRQEIDYCFTQNNFFENLNDEFFENLNDEQYYDEKIENIFPKNINDFCTLNNFFEKSSLGYSELFL